MFRAIGLVIALWGLSLFFGETIRSFDQAASATFNTVESVALVSQMKLESLK